MISVVMSVSQLIDQKPPRLADGLRQEREVVLDVGRRIEFGLRQPQVPPLCIRQVSVAHEKRHAEHDHGDHERREERHRNQVPVRRQRKPEPPTITRILPASAPKHRAERGSGIRYRLAPNPKPSSQP